MLPYLTTEFRESFVAAGLDPARLIELSILDTLLDTRLKNKTAKPNSHVVVLSTKVRFTCPGCKHMWTSGLGQFAAVFEQKKHGKDFSIKFNVIAYWFECKKCGCKGDMKAYQSEMERISVVAVKQVLQKFGFVYERVETTQKASFPRAKHETSLCQACRLGICKYAPKGNRRAAQR